MAKEHSLKTGKSGFNWNPELLDEYVSPLISMAKDIELPDPPDCPNYFGSYFINHVVVGVRYNLPIRYLFGIFIKRVSFSCVEYKNAFNSFNEYRKICDDRKTNSNISGYIKFLFYLESSIVHLSIAVITMDRVNKYYDLSTLFSEEKNSDLIKLKKIYNRIKHYDEDIYSSKENEMESIPATPIWIDNNEISCQTARLSLSDYVEVINSSIEHSKHISEEIPELIVKKRKEKNEDDEKTSK